ncbi:DUF1116 domain-containing protein [Synergistaceae bacterium OttesenSCG-928-I11]|nr:DUF1116 domain-containing protein [Synergistaceae bacterium OttesenSCG-928-I11]
MSSLKEKIEHANNEAVDRMINAQISWVGMKKAIDTCPGMKKNMVMHAGPPISWERMGDAQKKAVCGAAMYEGWGKSIEEADRLVASGEVELSPCHFHATVGSMTGITSPSMPVFVVKNETYGNYGHCHIYESPEPQKLSFGYVGPESFENLKFIDEVIFPVLSALIANIGSFNVKKIISRALFMGDELHSRSFASTSLFSLEVSQYLFELPFDKATLLAFSDFVRRSEQFFLHLVMAASKALADAANDIPYSTILTGIARNGVEVGIRVSGLGDEWFTGPSGPVEGLYFGNYTVEDAQPDMGDSAITETTGLGAMAHAASPALGLTKGSVEMAYKFTNEMQQICCANNPHYAIPYLGGQGSPVGVDIRKVLESGITPVINTGIASKKGGQIGVGNARVPKEAFKKAIVAFKEKYGNK